MSVDAIDIKPFRYGSRSDRAQVVAAVDDACRDIGFLSITGHGVPESLLAEMLDTCGEFFDLPFDVKRDCIDPVAANNRGYAAEGTEALGYSLESEEVTAPDLFEAFNVGREDAVGPYFDQFRGFFAPNTWPADMPRLQDVFTRYMAEVGHVSDLMLEVFALALGLDDQHLIHRTRRGMIMVRAINYQRRAGTPAPEPGQQRMGAHTDYGILTVLLADPVPGLEVSKEGVWSPVDVTEGSLIINLGDMLARWTNDRWVSTLHRVVPPVAGVNGAARRRSVAHFLEADPDCIIESFPTCVANGEEPKYGPVTAGDYLLSKLLGPRELRRSETVTPTSRCHSTNPPE